MYCILYKYLLSCSGLAKKMFVFFLFFFFLGVCVEGGGGGGGRGGGAQNTATSSITYAFDIPGESTTLTYYYKHMSIRK